MTATARIPSLPFLPARRTRRTVFSVAGLLAIGAVAGFGVRTADEPTDTIPSAALVVSTPVERVTTNPGMAVLFGPTALAATQISATTDPGVQFGSAAVGAAWAHVRYSTYPGLELSFSDLYPVVG